MGPEGVSSLSREGFLMTYGRVLILGYASTIIFYGSIFKTTYVFNRVREVTGKTSR